MGKWKWALAPPKTYLIHLTLLWLQMKIKYKPSGGQDQLHNLQGPVQNENMEPPYSKIKIFKMATAKQQIKYKALRDYTGHMPTAMCNLNGIGVVEAKEAVIIIETQAEGLH